MQSSHTYYNSAQGTLGRVLKTVPLENSGYAKHREILNYGNAHMVAHTMLHKICNQGQIKPNDANAPWDLFRDLQPYYVFRYGQKIQAYEVFTLFVVITVTLFGSSIKNAIFDN